jgi:hypothetical protein
MLCKGGGWGGWGRCIASVVLSHLDRSPLLLLAAHAYSSAAILSHATPTDPLSHPPTIPQVVGASSGNASEGQCYSRFVPCPAGQYAWVGRNASSFGYCTDCPAGSTSHNKGSTWCQCTQAGQVGSFAAMDVCGTKSLQAHCKQKSTINNLSTME